MTPKERLAIDIKDVARQWEDGLRYRTIMEERGVTFHCLRRLLRSHLGASQYDRIAREHKRSGTLAMKHLFRKGNTAHLCRKHKGSHPKIPVHSIRKWKRHGRCQRYMKLVHGCGGAGWKPVAILIWEKFHGPVPKGYVVGFKDGNSLNEAPENLCLISRTNIARGAAKANSYKRRIASERIRKLLSMRERAA